MELILEIATPGNGNVYEFQADDSLTVGELKALAAEEIDLLERGRIALDPGRAMLFHTRTRRVPDEGLTLPGAGIRGGDRLLLL